MFGFSTADWIFTAFIMVVIFVCIALSALIQKKKGGEP
jgi:hypothetical protein